MSCVRLSLLGWTVNVIINYVDLKEQGKTVVQVNNMIHMLFRFYQSALVPPVHHT